MTTPAVLRRDLDELVRLAVGDLQILLRQDPAQVRQALMDLMPALLDTYGAAASTLAADWYDDLRIEAEVAGTFRAAPSPIRDAGGQALVGWAETKAANPSTFSSLIIGGAQRRIVNFARDTIMGSSIADPRALGWKRTGTGRCDFCRMLIGRGAVYTERSANFETHDHCGCGSAPAFRR